MSAAQLLVVALIAAAVCVVILALADVI